MTDDEELDWVNFEPGEEASVLTTPNMCAFCGGCDKCPGFTTAGKVNPNHPNPDDTVCCLHWCHRAPHN